MSVPVYGKEAWPLSDYKDRGLFLSMAKTNRIVEEGVQTDYISVIVSYSNGIDSTGALYWALQEFPKEKVFLLYCDTGFEYPENIRMFYKTAALIGCQACAVTISKLICYLKDNIM